GSIKPYPLYPDFWNTYLVKSIYTVWFIGVVAAGYLVLPLLKKGVDKKQSFNPEERWILVIYLVNLLIATAFFLAFFGNSMAYYISGPIVFSFFLYLGTFGYFYTDNTEFTAQKPIKKYANKKIEVAESERLSKQLHELIYTTDLYQSKQLKLKNVAEAMGISTHLLSQLLNDNLGKSFNAYINERRIEAACELLQTTHHLSLEGIGYEVGFKSKSTFFTTFKKIKGLTPAKFQQLNSV
ncbi:MAG: helix-turn-helix domain-containing protein, partial [Bacteroidota bacterium]